MPENESPTLLDQFEADEITDLTHIANKWGIDTGKVAPLARSKREQAAAILEQGLDIGGIARYLIPVTMKKHPDYGWVFVSLRKYRRGEMFRAAQFIKGYIDA